MPLRLIGRSESRARGWSGQVGVLGVVASLGMMFGQPLARAADCPAIPTLPAQNAWQQGIGTVMVDIDPRYGGDQVGAIETAFNNWEASSVGAAAGIHFEFQQMFTSDPPPPNHYEVQMVPAAQIPGDWAVTTLVGPATVARTSATTQVADNITDLVGLTDVMAHDIGHTFALGDCTTCTPGDDTMAASIDANNPPVDAFRGPSGCDSAIAIQHDGYPAPSPSPSPRPSPTISPCPRTGPKPVLDGGCNPSPIIIDVDGSGYHLTDAAHGVLFDFFGTGHPVQMSWTARGSTNAFLVLDRNGDGKIDNGAELFGDLTEQPASGHPNGFAALAVFDRPDNAGNADGIIDARDAIFNNLRLWQDTDHDGIAQPSELHTLPALGITSISLHYQATDQADQDGNRFGYRATVTTRDHGRVVERAAYDVFLTTALSTHPASLTSPSESGGDSALAIATVTVTITSLTVALGAAAIRRRRSRTTT